jgi:hypothetical protein
LRAAAAIEADNLDVEDGFVQNRAIDEQRPERDL